MAGSGWATLLSERSSQIEQNQRQRTRAVWTVHHVMLKELLGALWWDFVSSDVLGLG